MKSEKKHILDLYSSIDFQNIHSWNYERLPISVKNTFIINKKAYVETVAKGFYNLRKNSVYLDVMPRYVDLYCDRLISELIESRNIALNIFPEDLTD